MVAGHARERNPQHYQLPKSQHTLWTLSLRTTRKYSILINQQRLTRSCPHRPCLSHPTQSRSRHEGQSVSACNGRLLKGTTIVITLERTNQQGDLWKPCPGRSDNPQTWQAVPQTNQIPLKVLLYSQRKYIDTANHSRREKRMLERANKRWDNAYTVYSDELTEEEQRYRDYFETDLQNYREDERVEEVLTSLLSFWTGKNCWQTINTTSTNSISNKSTQAIPKMTKLPTWKRKFSNSNTDEH